MTCEHLGSTSVGYVRFSAWWFPEGPFMIFPKDHPYSVLGPNSVMVVCLYINKNIYNYIYMGTLWQSQENPGTSGLPLYPHKLQIPYHVGDSPIKGFWNLCSGDSVKGNVVLASTYSRGFGFVCRGFRVCDV